MSRRLKFVCTDNVNSLYSKEGSKVLLVWNDGSFWLYADEGPHHPNDYVEDYGDLTREEWLDKGWRMVVEV